MELDTTIYLTDWLYILKGAGTTLYLCIIAMIFGALLGLFTGIMRTSKFILFQIISSVYVNFIRGTPLLMQIFIIYYLVPLFMGVSIPASTTAFVSLSLYTGGYIAEIVKAGLQSVNKGQKDAAKALGMVYWQEFIYIVFPQTLKVIIPPAFGFFIALIKDSSLVSIIGFIELARAGRLIAARTFKPFVIYAGVAIIYFIICYGLSLLGKRILERGHDNNVNLKVTKRLQDFWKIKSS